MPTPIPQRPIILSNRPPEYQKQYNIVQSRDGSLSFAPINRFALTLPPEIMSDIFLHCLPDEEFIDPTWSGRAPFLLCHICRQWRRIAMNTPRLWASLYIDYNWFGQTGTDTFLCDWVSRAKDVPLALRVDQGSGWSIQPGVNIDEDQLYTVLQQIGQRSFQWKNIWLCVYPDFVEDLFPAAAEFPELTKLCLDLTSEYDFGWNFQGYPPYALKNARSLHELQFERVPWMLTIPYETLKIYSAENATVLECIEILRNATNLSSSTFTLLDCSPDPITSLSPLVNLRDLTLSENAYSLEPLLTMDVLRLLTLPSLNHLHLKFRDAEDRFPSDISELAFLTSRSLHRLEKLTLCYLPTSEAGLMQCLQNVPRITSLRLQLCSRIDDLLNRLTNDRDFLPRLEYLHIIHGEDSWRVLRMEYLAPTPDGILDMLSSRRYISDAAEGPVQLQTFQFDVNESIHESEAANLLMASVVSDPRYKQLEDSGMNLWVGKLKRELDAWWVEY
ncbi:hypothetical protein C8R45DRAFT_998331 [Mycena sanguinolenta]|nr:hypothetical protein C8R45DRAFT_998331 [Mycena sanguinolenta]